MSKQVWGTFSVKDHCEANAFVAEVMLYDRLVIPVPPDEDERARWDAQKWQPKRLEKILKILGDRAYVVKWDAERQARWKSRYEARTEVAQAAGDWAFAASRTELTASLPRNVTGIQAVTNYTSIADFEKEVGLKADGGAMPLYGGTAIAVIGHEFLIPNDPSWDYEHLLSEAVALSSEEAFRRKRASFWRWQREFLSDKGITDQSAIREAVEEMRELVEEEKTVVKRKRIHTVTQFSFVIGTVILGLLSGPLSPLTLGGAFLSVGGFAADKLTGAPGSDNEKPVSLLRDIRKHFGWK